jgi:hypothetical protein
MSISGIGIRLAVLISAATACAACSATPSAQPHLATVSGTFVVVGGPSPGLPRPTAGVVTLMSSGGKAIHVTVGSNGNFRVQLAEGDYSLSGRSSAIVNGNYECTGGHVHLTTTLPPPVQVACQVP